MTTSDLYHLGYDPIGQEYILWKRGRKTLVCRIPLDNAPSLIETFSHVLAVRIEERERS